MAIVKCPHCGQEFTVSSDSDMRRLRKQAVLEAFKGNAMTLRQLSEATEIQIHTVRQLVRELQREGSVRLLEPDSGSIAAIYHRCEP